MSRRSVSRSSGCSSPACLSRKTPASSWGRREERRCGGGTFFGGVTDCSVTGEAYSNVADGTTCVSHGATSSRYYCGVSSFAPQLASVQSQPFPIAWWSIMTYGKESLRLDFFEDLPIEGGGRPAVIAFSALPGEGGFTNPFGSEPMEPTQWRAEFEWESHTECERYWNWVAEGWSDCDPDARDTVGGLPLAVVLNMSSGSNLATVEMGLGEFLGFDRDGEQYLRRRHRRVGGGVWRG